MTERTTQTSRARRAAPQQSLRGTVLWVAALAAVAAALVWSVLWMDLVHQRSDAAAAAAATPTGQVATPGLGPARRDADARDDAQLLTMPGTEHDHGFDAFGTRVRVLVGSRSPATAAAPLAALRVQALFQRMQRALTRFEADSELSRLNARAGEEVPVSATLLRAVEAALWAARLSDGLVDPTLIGDLERAGYANSRSGLASTALADALQSLRPAAAAAPSPAPSGAASRWTPTGAPSGSARRSHRSRRQRQGANGRPGRRPARRPRRLCGRRGRRHPHRRNRPRPPRRAHRPSARRRDRAHLHGRRGRGRHQRARHPDLAPQARLCPPPDRPRHAASPLGRASSRRPRSRQPRSRPRPSPSWRYCEDRSPAGRCSPATVAR